MPRMTRSGCQRDDPSKPEFTLRTETTVEPQMPADVAERYPHEQAVMNKYLGILMFKLRPLPGRTERPGRQPEAASR